MTRTYFWTAWLAATAPVSFASAGSAQVGMGQAPAATSDSGAPVSHRDRVYAAEQFSNTVSVTDPADNKLLGVIRLGDPVPGNLSPLLSRAAAGARDGLLRAIEPLAAFTTNPAGSAIVNALGPIRQVVRGEVEVRRRYLVIVAGTATRPGARVQIQARTDTVLARAST